METILAGAIAEAIRSGALKGFALVAVLAIGAYVYAKWTQAKTSAAQLAEQIRRDTAAEGQGRELISSVSALTTELRTGRETAAKESAEQRQAIALLAQRVEAQTAALTAAIAADGTLTREELADRRLTDATRTAERAATAALVVADARVPDSDPPQEERRRDTRSRMRSVTG